MKINPFSNKLVKVDKVLDYVPVVSSFKNLVHLFQKCVLSNKTKPENRTLYGELLRGKSYGRCVVLLLPIIGNIIIGIYDFTKKNQPIPQSPNLEHLSERISISGDDFQDLALPLETAPKDLEKETKEEPLPDQPISSPLPDQTVPSKDVEKLEDIKENSTISRVVEGPRTLRLKESRLKFLRAVENAKILGKGTAQGANLMATYYRRELVDPHHRYGRQLAPYFEAWKNSNVPYTFNEWIDKFDRGEKVPGSEGLDPPKTLSKVQYLDANQRKEYALEFKEETFTTKKEGVLTTQAAPHIFAMGPNGQLYTGVYKRGSFNHSSFFSGGAVLSAGELHFANGKLVKITDKSGHYSKQELDDATGKLVYVPSKQMIINALKKLVMMGVDLREVELEIDVLTDHTSTVNAQKFLRDYEFEKNPHYRGVIRTEAAKIQLKNAPIGASVLRYSPKNQDYILLKKEGEDSFTEIKADGKSLESLLKENNTFLIPRKKTADLNEENMRKDPRYHSTINKQEAEALLKDFRIGAALLRYSSDLKEFVISQKIGDNNYDHFPCYGRSLEEMFKILGIRVLIPPQ